MHFLGIAIVSAFIYWIGLMIYRSISNRANQPINMNNEKDVQFVNFLAEKGDAAAQFAVAGKHYESKDYEKAFELTKLAAEKGNSNAQGGLALMYANGEGVPKDYEAALKWYRLAADQGNAIAQLNLGVMYAEGKGVRQDYTEAIK